MNFLSLTPTDINNWFIGFSARLLVGTLVFAFFVVVATVVRSVISHINRTESNERRVLKVISFVGYYAVLGGGVIVVLSIFGINAIALTTGLGAVGVVLGIALQGYLSDVFSGFFIVFSHAFKVGDTISISGVTGRVDAITLRSTILTTEKQRIIVPNSLVAKNAVCVQTA